MMTSDKYAFVDMDKLEFCELAIRFEEIMMHQDCLLNQIDTCEEGCGCGDDEELCPKCVKIFEQVIAEADRLEGNEELYIILRKLREACDANLTGEYQRIVDRPKGGGVVH